jgi:hypothetical protein
LPAHAMAGAVDKKCAVLDDDDAGQAADQKATERARPAVVKKAGQSGQAKTDEHREQINVAMLPVHKGVALQIAHVVVRRLWIEFEKEPADVGVEKTFLDVVRIFLVIGVFVVAPMFARPHENRVFESARAEDEHKQSQRPFRFVGFVREEPVIAGRDAESGKSGQDQEHPGLEPIKVVKPKINRQTDNGEEGRSDEERTGQPINAMPRDRKNIHVDPPTKL